ncbi:Tim44-like domain-containing protein [Kickxella alabastrina]|uniref:Tim44-like domain-containing protein n=1 Tax=Kickxella alabastrina TaxID=61397 RepID=UPI00221FD9F2|nr:Tim44-like domain-containing protein [Kickxella alabastrina]KAI7823932.1 Tim44-like domain-containing protein [Kickxella alabastrina]
MACIGLRASNGLRGPLLQSVASTFYANTAKKTGRHALQRAFAPASVGFVRHHSQPREQHFVVTEFGLLSDFVPAPLSQQPSIFSKAGLTSVKTYVVEYAREVFSWVTLKYYLSGWKTKEFVPAAEDLYGVMNEAFAQGNLKTLEAICLPTMYASLKNDIKRRGNVSFEWRKISSVSPPKALQIRCGRLTSEFAVGQVVVRIDQEQAVVPVTARKGSGAANFSAAKPVRVTEYVVFQRVVSDAASPWRIYGKMNVPKWDLQSSKN